jgi:N-acetylglucosaminyldiphosphoundecaprenol N-acetyl-beta-D-mannosaminyltransferase
MPIAPDPASTLPTVNILGVAVHCVDFAATQAVIAAWMATPGERCRQICTVNPEFIMDARRDPAFAATLARADLRVPDGVGVLWAARLQGVRLRERVTGSDGVDIFCRQAAHAGWRVFFLGAGAGVAERAAAVLAARYPALARNPGAAARGAARLALRGLWSPAPRFLD